MEKHIDQLSKDLADGMSRRKAFKHFFAALGGGLFALLMRRPAKADGNAVCVQYCRDQGLTGRDFGECVSFSAHCPDGQCAQAGTGGLICVTLAIG